MPQSHRHAAFARPNSPYYRLPAGRVGGTGAGAEVSSLASGDVAGFRAAPPSVQPAPPLEGPLLDGGLFAKIGIHAYPSTPKHGRVNPWGRLPGVTPRGYPRFETQPRPSGVIDQRMRSDQLSDDRASYNSDSYRYRIGRPHAEAPHYSVRGAGPAYVPGRGYVAQTHRDAAPRGSMMVERGASSARDAAPRSRSGGGASQATVDFMAELDAKVEAEESRARPWGAEDQGQPRSRGGAGAVAGYSASGGTNGNGGHRTTAAGRDPVKEMWTSGRVEAVGMLPEISVSRQQRPIGADNTDHGRHHPTQWQDARPSQLAAAAGGAGTAAAKSMHALKRQHREKIADVKKMIRATLSSWNGSLRKIFHSIDADHSGTIDTYEMSQFLQQHLHLQFERDVISEVSCSIGRCPPGQHLVAQERWTC
jgi:hypothetical protein